VGWGRLAYRGAPDVYSSKGESTWRAPPDILHAQAGWQARASGASRQPGVVCLCCWTLRVG
jgi:carbohydrate-selective porin OprB